MQPILEDLVRRLQNRQFPNEQAIKQGVVLRILETLGWDIYDPQSVRPEFAIGANRVDFALCHPHETPQVFIEVKQSNTFDAGEDQLMLRYAFQHGVQIAVLTDGQRWAFYAPGGAGTFQERRFYHLDLLERDLSEAQERLQRYLSLARVKNGKAVEAARADLNSAARNRAVAASLPKAWDEMLGEGDEILCLALIEKVQTLTGFSPEIEEARAFLLQLSAQPQNSPSPAKTRTAPKIEPDVSHNSGDNWFAIDGIEQLRSKRAIDVTVETLRALQQRIPDFLQIFERERAKQTQGKKQKRRWISQQRENLYDNAELISKSIEITNSWWLGTNYSNSNKREMLELAQSIAKRHKIKLTFALE